jgi:cyanophycin synthetase
VKSLGDLRVRAEVVRALGPRVAWRFRSLNVDTERLRGSRESIYRRLWEEAAAEVGATVRDLGSGFLELRLDRRATRVRQEFVEIDSQAAIALSFDKTLVHGLLTAEGLPVPEHVELGDAEELLRQGPVVVKPADGTGIGAGVTGNVRTPEQLAVARAAAQRYGPRVLVERSVPGEVYRLLLLDGQLLDAVRRGRPVVTGDGHATIAELVARENRRRLGAGGEDGLSLLRPDLDFIYTLQAAGRSPRSVLADGERVAVKTVTNQNRADENETVRVTSPALTAEAAAAARLVGLRLAGVDLIAPGLDSSLAESGGVVLEVNCTPGLHHHYLVADRDRATRVAAPILRELLG